MKKYMVMAVFAMIAIMALGMLNTGAWFSDDVTGGVANIKSAKLSIADGQLIEASLGTIDNMAPGDKTEDAVIYITNNGNIPLVWIGDLVIEGSEALRDVIYIDYALMEFEGGQWAEVDDNFITDGVGSGPHPGWYNTLAGMSTYGKITLKNFDGNNGMGIAPWEFKGALKPGFAYRLTLRFGFVEEAGNDYQDLGPVNISFRVKATQNNLDAIGSVLDPRLTINDNPEWYQTQLDNQIP